MEPIWETVRRATSLEQREAIYRFRYEVYVVELNRLIGGVDHARKMVVDETDEDPLTVHFFVEADGFVIGAMRVVIWEPGHIPIYEHAKASLEGFAGIERMKCCYLGRLMLRPSARGRLVVPSILRAAFALDDDIELSFGSCRPGLVAHYERLGFRGYAGRPVQDLDGLSLPIVIVHRDVAALERVSAPMASLARGRFGAGDKEVASRLAPLFRQEATPLVTDAARVWLDLQAELADRATPAVFEGLGEAVLERLASFSLIFDVPAGELVTREGHIEREMFLILSGVFEAFSGDRVHARMTDGESFGEVAFFHQRGARSASVRAVTDGRLVCLRRSAIAELGRVDPEAAQTLLFNLGRILSNRVVKLTPRGA